MARLWTGKGDDGTTGLLFGGREAKASDALEAVGAVDEAQAAHRRGPRRGRARRASSTSS